MTTKNFPNNPVTTAIARVLHSPGRPAMLGAAASILLLLSSANLALAQGKAAEVAFKMEQQPLASALTAFSRQTGLQVVHRNEFVSTEGLMAPRLYGTLTPEAALKQLLANTGLKYEFLNERTVRITASAPAPRTGADTAQLAPVQLAQATPSVAAVQQESRAVPAVKKEEAQSQTEDELYKGIPEMLVKGSKSLNADIERTEDDNQPFVVFDSEEIKRSGVANLEDFLKQRLPMNTSKNTASDSAGSAGGNTSSIDLRGLGSLQTLILVDGYRVSGLYLGGAPGQPDINAIPMASIERIEVLPATASGIYGGSATGGVINIIRKRDYQGLDVSVGYDNTLDSDAAKRRVDVSAGFSFENGRTTLQVAGSYSDANVLSLGDRDFIQRGRAILRQNNPASFLPTNAAPLGATPNIRAATVSGAAPLLVLDDGRPLGYSYTHLPVGYTGFASDNGQALIRNAGTYNYDQPPTGQTGGADYALQNTPVVQSLSLTLRREFSSRVQAFVDMKASENLGRGTTSGVPTNFTLLANAANNPFRQDIVVTMPSSFMDGVAQPSEVKQQQAMGGVIVSLPKRWQLAADYTWNYNEFSFNTAPSLSSTAAAPGVILRDNILFPVDYSALMEPGVAALARPSTMRNAAVRLSGPLFDLPGGPLTLSTLAEHRDEVFGESGQVLPPNAGGVTFFYPERSQSTAAAYVEARLPIVSERNAMPLVRELEFQLAGRWEKVKVNGVTLETLVGQNTPLVRVTNENDSVDPTLSARWKPFDDLMLRASWGTGFLSPSVSQVVPTAPRLNVTAPAGLIDPRRNNEPILVYNQLGDYAAVLKPETSESWSAGLVFTPGLLEGLRLSVDLTVIEKSNNIGSVPGGLQGRIDNEASFPFLITRGPSTGSLPGPITGIDQSNVNLAKTYVKAYDAQANYLWNVDRFGEFNIYAIATWQTRFDTQTIEGAALVDRVNYDTGPLKFKANGGLTWRRGDLSVGWSTRYFDSHYAYSSTNTAAQIASRILSQGSGGLIPSQIYHDVVVGYEVSAAPGGLFRFLEGTEMQLGLRNAFDKSPPFDSSNTNTLYSRFGDPRLRSYWMNFRKSFSIR